MPLSTSIPEVGSECALPRSAVRALSIPKGFCPPAQCSSFLASLGFGAESFWDSCRSHRLVGPLTILLAFLCPAEVRAWQMKQAPLMTDWAQQVNPTNTLPEYPRPQMVRSNWL